MVSLDDEIEVNMFILLHELLEGGGYQCLPDACGAPPEIAEVERELPKLKYTSSTHLIL